MESARRSAGVWSQTGDAITHVLFSDDDTSRNAAGPSELPPVLDEARGS